MTDANEDVDSVLSRHKSLLEKYAQKFNIDLKRDDADAKSLNDSSEVDKSRASQRLSQIEQSFNKYLERPTKTESPKHAVDDPRASINSEEDVLIGEVTGKALGMARTEPARRSEAALEQILAEKPSSAAAVFAVDESVNVDEILKRYKSDAGTTRVSQRSLGEESMPKVDLSNTMGSIDELVKRCTGRTTLTEKKPNSDTTMGKKAPPKPDSSLRKSGGGETNKSEDDINVLINRIKAQMSSQDPSSSRPENKSPKEKPVPAKISRQDSQTRSTELNPSLRKSGPTRSKARMPPKVRQSLDTDTIQRRLRESVKRRSLEELCTLKRH